MKIVAIGGGEIGRPGYPIETVSIDRETIRLTGKENPRLLFLPTASGDSVGYYETVKKYFGEKLGCKIDVLYLLKNPPTIAEIKRRIKAADIIYVGGGNTLRMVKRWRVLGVDKLIKQAADKGTILSGVSAGAIAWFRFGVSDSWRTPKNPKAPLIRICTLAYIKALFCPHYDVEQDRPDALKRIMKRTPGVAVAVGNCAALEIVNDQYRLIRSKRGAVAYRVFWRSGKYVREALSFGGKFAPLAELVAKV